MSTLNANLAGATVRRSLRAAVPVREVLLCTTVLLATIAHAKSAELPLERVVLSTAGLAQFTRAGSITAGSSVDLTVRLDQVDDVLKSLTVFDRQGAIGAVSLPGKAPLAELFRDLPFGPSALNSLAALLNALVGSEVEVQGKVDAKGRVFRVETEQVALPNNGGTTQRHRLTLMADKGLVQTLLEDTTALRFTDGANAQIERALAGLTENRAKERRQLSIGFLGEGTRKVAISYVVAAPVWKTAYRLIVPKEGGNAHLQGWAVVENLTGGDWNNVELMLVSGNPVALRQPLYTAFFSERTEVPVTTAARLLPQTDDTEVSAVHKPSGKQARMGRALPAAPAQQLAQIPRPGAGSTGGGPAPAAEGFGGLATAAEAEEASTQLLYRFPAKVSLATGHTMMVPFVDREVSASRSWLYQPDTAQHHPLAAVRLKNDGDSGLPAGIVTAYDTSQDGSVNYVGDAQMPLLPRGTFKFVTFALDSKTNVRREDQGVKRTTLGRAVNGVLTLTTRSRRTIAYEITPPPDEDREVIVEEPRLAGWVPADAAAVEETPTRLRYKISAQRGATTKAAFAVEHVDSQTVMLTDLAAEDILARIRGLQNESPMLKETAAKLGGIVAEINKAKAQRAQIDQERRRIAEDQDRIRRNLESAGQGSDLGRRYLETLKSQEDRLGELARTDEALEAAIEAKRQAAEQLARELTL
jgi:hypothetical protein